MVFQYLALDKWIRLIRIISQNGGPFGSLAKLWRTDTLKEGKLMGTDSFGNKYYENTLYMISRSRWVEFNPNVKWEYDASQVTAEWFGWLHYKTDRLPSQDCAKYCLMSSPSTRCWLLPHEENLTGTEKAYYPYTTIKAHIYVWDEPGYILSASLLDFNPNTLIHLLSNTQEQLGLQCTSVSKRGCNTYKQ